MTRKYKLIINNTTIDVEVNEPSKGSFTITLGEDTFPVEVTDDDSSSGKYKVTVGDIQHRVQLQPNPKSSDYTIKIAKESYTAFLKPHTGTPSSGFRSTTRSPTSSTIPETLQAPRPSIQEPTEPGTVTAPLPGRVLEVCVKEGTTVKQGNVLLVLEAMKMANEIRAPQDGEVTTIHVNVGTTVEKGQAMLTIQ